jgi:23S rRNA (cytidine1920-2'-O)/16S rRNA (cytidine1409-2'-O)-methyltransferase
MRLDAYLVADGKVTSRGRAKRAIMTEKVTVDRKIVTKPSKQVGYSNTIEVIEDIDVPAGYLKLKTIQKQTGIIRPHDIVLDLGSSAGGFLLFASTIAAYVKGIEYSNECMPLLEHIAEDHNNITVTKGDVFTMNPGLMSDKPVDLILNDITVEPEDSIRVLERVLSLLKPDGRVVQVLKLSKKSGLNTHINHLQELGLTIQHILQPKKREIYVTAVRNGDCEVRE